jgi:hypothetical protein
MKWYIIILLCSVNCDALAQQELPQRQEQQLENIAEREERESEDDSFLLELEKFRRQPVNLNTATADDLERLQLLNALQVHALLQYRLLLGSFINLYELQAVPHWDVTTIQKVLPYVSVNDETAVVKHISNRLRSGNGSLLVRLSQSFPKNSEYDDTTAAGYIGSPQKILVRYRYNYKNTLQWGLLADKDAGETVFKAKQRMGFDFYSAHLFVRNVGIIHSLALGDFTVNMGQGLIQWQSLGFRKSTEITAIKRQAAVLRPYTSAGEYNFHRGVGITLHKKRMSLTVFVSRKKFDANIDADTSGNATISSFIISGLHRSQKEMEKRNNAIQLAGGFNLSYKTPGRHIGANYISYAFSHPIQKKDEPYNYYALSGKRLANYSIDYDYTVKNMHLFGELAFGRGLDGAVRPGLLQGVLVSLDRRADASLVFRHLEPGFQSLYSTAFTENSLPTNESGLFMGLSLKPIKGVRLDVYADVFQFPWLKLRVDHPGTGREFLVQLAYEPNKRVEVVSRFRSESKESNKTNWRMNVSWQATSSIRLRQRMELVWFNRGMPSEETGYIIYNDISWQPPNKPFDLGGRLQLFETDGFDSRIYAFENDVPSSYSVSAIYHKGLRFYVNCKIDVSSLVNRNSGLHVPSTQVFLRWGQTVNYGSYQFQNQSVNSCEYKVQMIFLGF